MMAMTSLQLLRTGNAEQTCYHTFDAPLRGISRCRRERFCCCLFPCRIRYSLQRTIFLRKLSRVSYLLHPLSMSMVLSWACFSRARRIRREAKGKKRRRKKLLLLLFISLSFISFLFMNFFGRKREEMELEINSLRRERQQTINKIPIDDEAHAAADCHIHSYLKLKEFSFAFLQALFLNK